MAFDKIVAADSATYQLPALVRGRISSNISGGTEQEYTAVAGVVNAILADSDLGSLPKWTTSTRPSSPGESALIGFNTETEEVEFYNTVSDEWLPIGAGSKFTVSGTAPSEAENGDTWFNSETGSTYIYYVDGDSSQWVEIAGSGGSGDVIVADTAPTSPQSGNLWYDSVSGSTFIYYVDSESAQWVEIGQTAQPTSAYIRETAPASAENGQLWLDSTDGRLYVFYKDGDGSQWIGVRSAESTTGAFVSETAPLAPNPGDLWLDSTEGLMYVWYVDGDSSQWVAAVGGTNTPPPLARADLPAGSVLQVVSTTLSSAFTTASSTYTPITGLSQTITLSSTSSKVMVFYSVFLGQATNSFPNVRLLRDSTAVGIGDASGTLDRVTGHSWTGGGNNEATTMSGNFLDSPSSVASLTYAMHIRATPSGTQYVNRNARDSSTSDPRAISTITVMEVAG